MSEDVAIIGIGLHAFGRTPGVEGNRGGRDHHPYGFTVWMAGAGLKRGIVHGRTDELGFHAVEDRHYITDIHATVLHLLGLDPRRLDVPGGWHRSWNVSSETHAREHCLGHRLPRAEEIGPGVFFHCLETRQHSAQIEMIETDIRIEL